MDPLSIAAAVVGIAGFGLQVHQALFAFVNNVSNADQCIQALMTDINLTVSALRSIHELLKDEEGLRQTSRGRRLFSDDGLADTKRAAEQCMVTFKSIVAFILKKGKKGKYEVGTNDQDPNYLRLNRAHILSKLEKINWAIAQAQVDLYTARLVTFKISLLLIFSVISLKAQHQDLNNNDIISHIDDLTKAKAAARRRWVILQAAVLREEPPLVEPSQLPVPTINHTVKPQPPTEASASLLPHDHDAPEASTPAGNKTSADHVVPADGDMDNPRMGERPSHVAEVDRDKILPERPSEVDTERAGATATDTARAAPEPPLQNVTTVDHNIDPTPPQGPAAVVIDSERTLSGSRKDSQRSTSQYLSSNDPNRLKLAMKEFKSFDAYLYKKGIVRSLQYTETHIDELTQHVLSHGSSRWWKVFSSLSEDEYEGVEEAMASRRTEGTRALVGIQIIITRYKVVLRTLLRLISLGILDHSTPPTRTLLIIIGNKEADGGGDSETRLDETRKFLMRRQKAHVPARHHLQSSPSPVRYAQFPQAANVRPHPSIVPYPPSAPQAAFSIPAPPPNWNFQPVPQRQPIHAVPQSQTGIRLFPPPPATFEKSEKLQTGTPSGPRIMEHKSHSPDDPPRNLRHLRRVEPRSKQKGKGRMRNRQKKMNANEEQDSLSDDDSLYASSLIVDQDTVTDAARNRVQELLARWTAPEHDASTSGTGDGDNAGLREAARPDAPPVAGRGMAGSLHPNREDQNDKHKGVPASTGSQAIPEEAPPEQAPPEQAPPEQAPPEQAPPEQATPEPVVNDGRSHQSPNEQDYPDPTVGVPTTPH